MEKYDQFFKEAYSGYRGSKEKFFDKILSEKLNSSELCTLDDLKNKSSIIFDKSAVELPVIKILDLSKVGVFDDSQIFINPLHGKQDSHLSLLINKLKNTDWVRHGQSYLNHSDDLCPFCQKELDTDFSKQLLEIFDSVYDSELIKIKKFGKDYCLYFDGILNSLKDVLNLKITSLDFSVFSSKVDTFISILELNKEKISRKIDSPSESIQLASLSDALKELDGMIQLFNKSIQEYNRIVSKKKTEEVLLKEKMWRFSYTQVETCLSNFEKESMGKQKGIEGIRKSIFLNNSKINTIEQEIKILEKQIVNVEKTIGDINAILKSFGFNNFSLKKGDTDRSYKIARSCGTDAQDTLSEGEYTFITFLYFYHLIKGSTDASGFLKNKVIVIDDPISSLDSSVIFIVSNLVKNIVKMCRDGLSEVKQVFILTHNVYFYKEVTFFGARENKSLEESYWIISKIGGSTSIKEHEKNPIKTSYQLLWTEIASENKNCITIFNTMRRILEYYFNILGSMNYESFSDKFTGQEAHVFSALLSWVNDGSHYVNDDLHVSISDGDIECYHNVFKKIFEHSNHKSHYDMMMNSCTR